MKLQVTKQDIRFGKRRNCVWCPIARAGRRQLQKSDVFVGQMLINIRPQGDEVYKSYYLPQKALDFIVKFDLGIEVGPFEFELDLSEDNRYVDD